MAITVPAAEVKHVSDPNEPALMNDQDSLHALRAENTRLAALLDAHGIQWRSPPENATTGSQEAERSNFSTDEKVALFRRLFRGRTDVYPDSVGEQDIWEIRPRARMRE